jgi:hypothetical protein
VKVVVMVVVSKVEGRYELGNVLEDRNHVNEVQSNTCSSCNTADSRFCQIDERIIGVLYLNAIWKLREPPTSREDSLMVVEGRWRGRNHPTSHRDSLVLVIVVDGDVAR